MPVANEVVIVRGRVHGLVNNVRLDDSAAEVDIYSRNGDSHVVVVDFDEITFLDNLADKMAPVVNHHHTFHDVKLHKPTWCAACTKFIWGTKALQCDTCCIVLHTTGCVAMLPRSLA